MSTMTARSSSRSGLLMLAVLTALLAHSQGFTPAPPVGGVATTPPLKGSEAKQAAAVSKVEAMEVSDVTRENSNAGDSVRAPKVLESRSLSDASDPARAEDTSAAPPQPIKKKNIWHQLSGIVTGNKGASPSPARQQDEASRKEEEPAPEEPVKRKNIWHQLSGIVIGGRPASPSPARAAVETGSGLREKSLSRAQDAPLAATPTPTGKAPTVPPLKGSVTQETKTVSSSKSGEAATADGNQTNFTVSVYPVEDPNTVRWAPMKLDDQVLVPVYFKPKPKHLKFDHNTKDVTLVGSWSGWQDHFKLQPRGTACWDGVVNIPPGRHYFKFIVDNQWTIVGQWPVEEDAKGNINNVIEIPEPSSNMLMQEKKSVFAKKKKFGLF